MREIVICSAVRSQEGSIIMRGFRHSDCIRSLRERGISPGLKPEDQGFITSTNRYVTREEGRKLQDAAGIPSADPEGYRGDTLFSEDLY